MNIIGIDLDQKRRRKALSNFPSPFMVNDNDSPAYSGYINILDITKAQNWEVMSMSTAQGAAAVAYGYLGAAFDGRYIYYGPYAADTKVGFLRYDTSLLFTAAASWEKISCSTAMGSSYSAGSFVGVGFDGRYVYYSPIGGFASAVRYDTLLPFTSAASWEKCSLSSIYGTSTIASTQTYEICYDGRYIYFAPNTADTFVRFDTNASVFTDLPSWEKINMSTAQGAAILDNAYNGMCFDGRYIYYIPFNADTFLRFDTTLAFTNSSAWSQMSLSTAQGGAALNEPYMGASFDGRYVYFCPQYSDTFLRFDTTKSFTNSSAWEQMSMSTAQGGSPVDYAYAYNVFDGRYIWFAARSSDTYIRFDTTKSFTNSSAWEKISMSTAHGAAALDEANYGAAFDGKYVYFCPAVSTSFIRVLANPSRSLYK